MNWIDMLVLLWKFYGHQGQPVSRKCPWITGTSGHTAGFASIAVELLSLSPSPRLDVQGAVGASRTAQVWRRQLYESRSICQNQLPGNSRGLCERSPLAFLEGSRGSRPSQGYCHPLSAIPHQASGSLTNWHLTQDCASFPLMTPAEKGLQWRWCDPRALLHVSKGCLSL